MSVLNQMLRSLEERGAQPALVGGPDYARAAQTVAVPLAASARSIKPSRRQIVWLGVLLSFAAFAATDLWLQSRVHDAAQRPLPLGARTFGASAVGTAQAQATETVAIVQSLDTAATNSAPTPIAAMPSMPAEANGGSSASSSASSSGASSGASSSAPIAASSTASSTARRAPSDTRSHAVPSKTPNAAPAARPTAAPSAPTATDASPRPAPGTIAPAKPTPRKAAQTPAPVAALTAPPPAVPSPSTPNNETTPLASITPSASSHQPDAAVRRAAELIARGRTHEAMSVLKQLLRDAPHHHAARRALAALQSERGLNEAALVTLLEGVAVDAPRFALPAAQLQAQLGDRAGALRTLARVPPDTRSAAQHALTGGLALQTGAPALARDAYTQATSATQIDPVWWVGLALAHEALGDLAAAGDALARAAQEPTLPGDVRSFVAQRLAALRTEPAPAPQQSQAQR